MPCMHPPRTTAPRFKIGASLLLPMAAFDDDAASKPSDLSNVAVRSRLCTDDGRVVRELVAHWTNRAAGQFVLTPAGDGTTAGLRPGRYRLDVAVTVPAAAPDGADLVLCSESADIELVDSQTLRAP